MRTRAKILKTAASLALAGAVVTGAIELGTPGEPKAVAASPAAPYYREGELPAYPNALEFPLGESLAVNGMPVRISHFETADGPERVRDFYLDGFARLGTQTHVVETEDGGYSVSALISGGSAQAVVVISPRKGATEVFPSVFPMAAAPGDSQVPDSDIPFSAAAVGISRVSEEGEGKGEVVSYHEPTMKAETVAAFIKEQLGQRGWFIQSGGEPSRKGGQVVATKGGKTALFSIVPFSYEPVGASVVAKYGPSED